MAQTLWTHAEKHLLTYVFNDSRSGLDVDSFNFVFVDKPIYVDLSITSYDVDLDKVQITSSTISIEECVVDPQPSGKTETETRRVVQKYAGGGAAWG